jgi:murein DD-endopeptidase MepM/ murein hydrolase activator NlpD
MENEKTSEPVEVKQVKPKLLNPVKSTRMLDGFKEHQARNSATPGIDYPVAYGHPIVAAHKGKVTIADKSPDGSGGRVIEIKAGPYHTYYMHLSIVLVKEGDNVEAGQLIGKAGGSGFGVDKHYGTHLHFALRFDGDLVDPLPHILK